MNTVTLKELIKKWEIAAKEPRDEIVEDSEHGRISSAVASGCRHAKRECADTLRMLIEILG